MYLQTYPNGRAYVRLIVHAKFRVNVFKNISGRPGVRPPHCALKMSSQCVEKRYTPTSTEHTPLQSALFSH